MSSTRDFYKKKLSLCLSGARKNKQYDEGSNDELEEGEEEEEEEDEEEDDDQPAAIVRMSPMVGGGVSPQSSPVMGSNSGTEDVTWGLRHRMVMVDDYT